MAFNKRLFIGGAAVCKTETVTAFGANAAYSHNVALYQLDGNANDTTGNYNGTASNVTYASGYIGNAGVFNGSSSKIEVSDPVIPVGAASLSFWFNNDNTAGSLSGGETHYILGSGVSSLSKGLTAGFFEQKFFVVVNNGGSSSSLTGTTLFSKTNWNHCVVTWDGTTGSNKLKIYVNGNLEIQGTSSIAASTIGTYTNFAIGGTLSSGFIGGRVDQVRIFNREITAYEVGTLYAETSSTASNTNPLEDGAGVALYSFDYDASETGGLYDGTPTDVDFGVGGQINTGARFNGSSSFIDTNYTLPADSTMSFSFWINAKSLPSDDRYILSDLSSSATDRRLDIRLKGTDSAKLFIDIGNGSSNTTTNNTNFIPTLNTWHHIVVTLNGTSIKVYVDNASPISITSSVAFGTAGARSLSLGRAGDYNGGYYNGSIDQLRIFSEELSASEVSTLYAETACVHTATTTDVDYPVTNAAYYKLDNSAEDSKGTADGTETGNVEYRFGRYGQATVFDGSSCISLPQPTFSGAFSFSIWVNTTSTGLQSIIGMGGTFGNYTAGLNMWAYQNKLYSSWGNGSSEDSFTIVPSTIINTGNWFHIVLTTSGLTNPTVKAYINGVLVATEVSSQTINTTTYSSDFSIGAKKFTTTHCTCISC